MKIRKELEPNIEKSEQLFPILLDLISKFDHAFDAFDKKKMDEIIHQINLLIDKEIDKEDIYEYWGYTSAEDLAFGLTLTLPKHAFPITEEELSEIKSRIQILLDADENMEKSISTFLFEKEVSVASVLIDEYYSLIIDHYNSTRPGNIIYL